MALPQFTNAVDRTDYANPNEFRQARRNLDSLWRGVAQPTNLLVEWAQTQHRIADEPLVISPEGASGPTWAVEIYVACNRLNQFFAQRLDDADELFDAAHDFNDLTEKHMFLADKALREAAGELSNLSRIVLGSLSNE
jgi:hypothetical protein